MVTLVHRFVHTVVVCAGEYERAEVVFTRSVRRCVRAQVHPNACRVLYSLLASACMQWWSTCSVHVVIVIARECVHAVSHHARVHV